MTRNVIGHVEHRDCLSESTRQSTPMLIPSAPDLHLLHCQEQYVSVLHINSYHTLAAPTTFDPLSLQPWILSTSNQPP
jgi:hypothetical protein